VQEEPLAVDGRLLARGGRRRRRAVEGVGDERRDGAPERQGREVEHARRQHIRRLGPRGCGGGHRQRRDHLEILEPAPALVELEGRLLGPARRARLVVVVAALGELLGRRRRRVGAGEHLDHLLEGGGVGLDEGGGERRGVDDAGRQRAVRRRGRRGGGRRGGGGRGGGVPRRWHGGEELLGCSNFHCGVWSGLVSPRRLGRGALGSRRMRGGAVREEGEWRIRRARRETREAMQSSRGPRWIGCFLCCKKCAISFEQRAFNCPSDILIILFLDFLDMFD
jgi:hypothetical protein